MIETEEDITQEEAEKRTQTLPTPNQETVEKRKFKSSKDKEFGDDPLGILPTIRKLANSHTEARAMKQIGFKLLSCRFLTELCGKIDLDAMIRDWAKHVAHGGDEDTFTPVIRELIESEKKIFQSKTIPLICQAARKQKIDDENNLEPSAREKFTKSRPRLKRWDQDLLSRSISSQVEKDSILEPELEVATPCSELATGRISTNWRGRKYFPKGDERIIEALTGEVFRECPQRTALPDGEIYTEAENNGSADTSVFPKLGSLASPDNGTEYELVRPKHKGEEQKGFTSVVLIQKTTLRRTRRSRAVKRLQC